MNELPARPVSVPRVTLLLVLGIALMDFCFWSQTRAPGLSVPVFFLGCSVLLILARRSPGLSSLARLLMLLLGGCMVAGAIKTGCTNTYSFLLLTLALAAELQFPAFPLLAARCLAQFRATFLGPFRLLRLVGQLLSASIPSAGSARMRLSHRIVWTIPVVALGLIFGALFDSGNAVFDHWTGAFFTWLGQALWRLFDINRVSFWLCGAVVLLPLMWPSDPRKDWQPRLLCLPRFSENAADVWPSFLTLVILNLLFLCNNATDLIFLWGGQPLPAGVTYASFVHEGTLSLIVVALLSAFVLTLIFQQAPSVAGRKDLKLLAHLWIVQNIFLLASVALRLKRYIEAYDMTVPRLSLLIFLVLVGAGYVLLTIKIESGKSLSWLLGGAALSVFCTFYLTQFLNLGGWAADYNVRQWEESKFTRNLDVNYLHSLGPAAWPALRRAYAHDVVTANSCLDILMPEKPTRLNDLNFEHWREWSLREWWNRPAWDAIVN